MALGRHSHRACPLTQWAPLTTWITLLISVTYMASMALSQRTPHNTWHSLYSWYSRNPPFISDISVFFSCFHMFYFAWLRRNGSTLDTQGLKMVYFVSRNGLGVCGCTRHSSRQRAWNRSLQAVRSQNFQNQQWSWYISLLISLSSIPIPIPQGR